MSNYDDRLKDYVDVKERVRLFYERHPDGRLVTTGHAIEEIAGDPYVLVSAAAYRTPDDPLPGMGTSWLKVPGSTPYTRGSEIENAETSAWGRAIGALGIGIDKSIASGDEVRNKAEPVTTASVNAQERERVTARTVHVDVVVPLDDGGLIGTAIAQGTQDFELRQGPEGYTLPFRVKNGSKSFIVLAEGKLAEALSVIRPTVEGQRVTVWGHWTDETIPAKGNKPQINYRILHLERIETPDGMLPPITVADDLALKLGDRGPDGDDDPDEAPSAELFTGPEFDRAAS